MIVVVEKEKVLLIYICLLLFSLLFGFDVVVGRFCVVLDVVVSLSYFGVVV